MTDPQFIVIVVGGLVTLATFVVLGMTGRSDER